MIVCFKEDVDCLFSKRISAELSVSSQQRLATQASLDTTVVTIAPVPAGGCRHHHYYHPKCHQNQNIMTDNDGKSSMS